ncbi:hypothetical protein GCM10010307_40760 [Streptomyces vastus]|uniref:Uncharacterized protein n=1 Tax=Streptomyces vastus TaxID=285451 RepID=A0ABP6DBA1_9ACTN
MCRKGLPHTGAMALRWRHGDGPAGRWGLVAPPLSASPSLSASLERGVPHERGTPMSGGPIAAEPQMSQPRAPVGACGPSSGRTQGRSISVDGGEWVPGLERTSGVHS